MYLNFLIFLILTISCVATFVVLRYFYRQRRGVCSSDLFVHADRIELCSWMRARKDIYFDRVDLEHRKIAAHFTDKLQSEQKFTYPKKLRIVIGKRTYTLFFSTLGWNFLGEAPNSRELDGGLELVKYVEELFVSKKGKELTLMYKPIRQLCVAVIGLLICLPFLFKSPRDFKVLKTEETLADFYKYDEKLKEHPLSAFRPQETDVDRIARNSRRRQTFYDQGQIYKKLYCNYGMLTEVKGLPLQISYYGLKVSKKGKRYVELILAYSDPEIQYIYDLPVGKIEFELKTGISSQLFELFVVDANQDLAIVEVLFDKSRD